MRIKIALYKTLYSKIPPEYRREFWRVMLEMFIKAVLNFAGIATLLYLVAMIIVSESLMQYLWVFSLLGAAFLLCKGLLILWIDKRRMNYLLRLYKYYSLRLLNQYYSKGMLTIRRKGSGQLTHDVNNITFYYVNSFLRSIMNVTCEFMLLCMIVIALAVYSPMAMLCAVGVYLPVSLVYMLLVQKRLTQLGREESELTHQHYQTTENTFRGYAEVEINQAFSLMNAKFESELDTKRANTLKINKLTQIPNVLLEVSIAVLILAMVLILGYDNRQLGVTLGVLSVAALRTLPSIKSLLSSWNLIKNTSYSLEVISALEHETEYTETSSDDLEFNHDIELRDVKFRYEQDEPYVLYELSLEIKRGEYVGLRGESGCGKSTIFHLMQGFLSAQSGGVYIDGTLLTEGNRASWHKIIGYVPQDVFILSGSILENVVFGSKQDVVDRSKVREILNQLNMGDWVDSFAEGLDHHINGYGTTISGGQKQRLGIARALYKGAKVLFFDEATSSLDAHSEMSVMKIVQQIKLQDPTLTMIIIAHRESTLEVCDRVIEIKRVRR